MKTNTASTRNIQPSSLESHVGFWLRYVSNHVSQRFSALVESEGVSVSEWVALRYLFDTGSASTAEIIEALGMTKGAVSKIVSRLEEKQLVKRANGDLDRREQTVTLTTRGRSLVPRLAQLADKNDDEFFGHLTEIQRNALIDAMKEIVQTQHLKEIPVG